MDLRPVFTQLPRLFERAGNNDKGYITGIYTVLAEDEQEGEDPVTEEVRLCLTGTLFYRASWQPLRITRQLTC